MLAVRRVTQDNQGKNTAGVDGVKKLSSVQRLTMVKKLVLKGKSKPTRRVWIDKPGTDEKRPLGIPTMYDRALQALVKLALEPEWEALFESNSYGFRPGRSCHDAIEKQIPVGKYKTGHCKDKPLGFKTLIKPSKEKIKVHYDRIADVIDQHKAAPQAALITHLNPIIKGWANYYSIVISKETFSALNHMVYLKLKSWAKSRHPNKTGYWITNKYWQTIGGDNWVFATRQEGENPLRLLKHSATKIVRHVKVKGDASPYDGNLVVRIEAARESGRLKDSPGKRSNASVHFLGA
jgi:hypothetical protein